jgi:hypothetical protein
MPRTDGQTHRYGEANSRLSEFYDSAQQQVIPINKLTPSSLMFVPCVIRRSRNNQHYALIYTNPVFHILPLTCFDSSLPSSGSSLDLSELLEIHFEWVVYHTVCG